VVEPEGLCLEKEHREDSKYDQRNRFLDNFQLPQVERTAVAVEAKTIGGHLEDIFEKSNSPAYKDNGKEPKATEPTHMLEFQVPIPRNRHKTVGQQQEENSKKAFVHRVWSVARKKPGTIIQIHSWLF